MGDYGDHTVAAIWRQAASRLGHQVSSNALAKMHLTEKKGAGADRFTLWLFVK